MVTRIWWDGDDVIGTVKVLSTPAGQILRGLYDSGVKFGFSSRALGSLKEGKDGNGDSVQVVQPDLQLICFDAVSEPSAPGAYILNKGTISVNLKEGQTAINNYLTRGDRINRALNAIKLG
jgi:hypothetical protein